jgi:NAD(P)-dependent dehydrogenase (short-subunit alcohol dehydrogenase family)
MKNPLFGLHGKTALVVGGGGLDNKGIGASSSFMLAEAGARVMVADCSVERGNDMASLIRERGGEADAVVADVTKKSDIERMLDTTLDRFGALDCLVTIIGGGRSGPALDYTEESWELDMLLNLKYVWHCNKAAGASMISRKVPGSIVNISSVRSLTGSFHQMSYGVGKAGLNSMVRSLAVEWGEHGIRVNAVAPGATSAPSLAAMLENNPALAQHMKALVPLGRIGTPDEIAGAVVFLSSNLASYITGQTIVVDGAYLYNHPMVMYRNTDS